MVPVTVVLAVSPTTVDGKVERAGKEARSEWWGRKRRSERRRRQTWEGEEVYAGWRGWAKDEEGGRTGR